MSWSNYRSEITAQPKKNLDYLIDQHLWILIGCLFFQSKMVSMILQEVRFYENFTPLAE